MTFDVIATGSTGNAVAINGSILIDCGVPFKALDGVKKDLQLVLLTHAHRTTLSPGRCGRSTRSGPPCGRGVL